MRGGGVMSGRDEADARPLAVGDQVYDEGRRMLGRVMAVGEGRLHLRPVGGGVEWTTRPENVRPPTASERLSPRIAAMNKADGWGRRG